MSILIAERLEKRYRKRAVVQDVSLRVRSGEIVGLLGPNGAGKTTSFYMIVGLTPVDEGRIVHNDEEITRRPMHQRARMGIGYLPQESSIFRGLTAEQNIRAILELRREMSAAERAEYTEELLQEFGVVHVRNAPGVALSGGERRRVEIARALAMQPDFILLDEPFAGVDPLSVIDIQRIIGYLARNGVGILITDHHVRETLGICHRAYILNEGRVISEGTPEQILDDKEVRSVYLGDHFSM